MKILINEKISPHRYKDNHGYLICTDCIMARTGKQTYTRDECFGDGDSTEIEVDRPSKEVFDAKTMASFENVPITIEHPSVNVDPDNYNTLSVGHMRDIRKGTYEGQPVMVGTAVITDSEAIEKVESGDLTNLSCGYDCDIDDSDAPHQFNIRGNHIALCECPRAGITHIQDSKKPTKKKYEVTLESEDTMRDSRTRRVRDDEDWKTIYVETVGGKVLPYEYDANEETEGEVLNEIIDSLGEDGEDVLVAVYSTMTNNGLYGELYRAKKHSTDSRRRDSIRKSIHTHDAWTGAYNGGFWCAEGNRITITRKDGKWFTMRLSLIKDRQDVYDYIDGVKQPDKSIRLRDSVNPYRVRVPMKACSRRLARRRK